MKDFLQKLKPQKNTPIKAIKPIKRDLSLPKITKTKNLLDLDKNHINFCDEMLKNRRKIIQKILLDRDLYKEKILEKTDNKLLKINTKLALFNIDSKKQKQKFLIEQKIFRHRKLSKNTDLSHFYISNNKSHAVIKSND